MSIPTRSVTEVHLEGLGRQFNASGNPVYVWRAINYCLNEYPTSPLPAWCLGYLGEAASRVGALAEGRDFRKARTAPPLSESRDVHDRAVNTSANKIDWRRMTELIPAAFAFSSKGKSAFRDAHSGDRKVKATINDFQRRKRGEKPVEILTAINDQLGLSDPDGDGTAARAVIREGRRLLRGSPGKT